MAPDDPTAESHPVAEALLLLAEQTDDYFRQEMCLEADATRRVAALLMGCTHKVSQPELEKWLRELQLEIEDVRADLRLFEKGRRRADRRA